MNLSECLFGKTIDVCTWVQHAFIAVSIVSTLSLLFTGIEFFAAAAVSVGFIWRETQGPDRHLYWYRRLVASTDRIGDWVSPSVAALITAILFSLVNHSTPGV